MVMGLVFETLLWATLSTAHPLHTTLTEVSVDRAHHTARAVVRVFADDIAAALAHRTGAKVVPGKLATDTEATDYVLAALSIIDATGHTRMLQSCGVKRNGDLLWVCAEASLGPGIHGLSLKNATLCELYPDQVNIVQLAKSDGVPARSILFTRGDGAKLVL